jgi:hypothetical protein
VVAAARGASRTALVVVLLTLVAVTSACGAADPAGSPPPESSSSPSGSSSPGSPCAGAVGQADDVAASLVGLTEAEATARAGESGLQVRVAGRGAECYALTADYQERRVNIVLDDSGVVVAAGRG